MLFGAWVVLEVLVIVGQPLGWAWWVITHIAFLLFFAGVQAGLLHVGLRLYAGEQPTFADVFARMALGPKLLVGQLLYLGLVVGGLVCVVIPGLYFAARYALFGHCLVAGETSLVRSFQQSAQLGATTWSALLLALVVLFGLNLLGASVLGLGLLITLPLSVLVMVALYRQVN